MGAVSIAPAVSDADRAAIGALFDAYAESLPVDLAWQNFAAERANRPGRYAPPGGALLLARDGAGRPLGCIALRARGGGWAEIKRLYVAPAGRRAGLGRALLDAVRREAIRLGHRALCLDTLPFMAEVQALYLADGFSPIAAWDESPVPGTVFLGKVLA